MVNQAEIQRNIQRMKDKYIEKAPAIFVEIDPIQTEVGNELVDLKFNITENRKVMVSDISFRGNESIAGDKIKRYMQTRQAGMLPFMVEAPSTGHRLMPMCRSSALFYLGGGFVDGRCKFPESFLSFDKRTISVVFDVEEGPKYKVGKIDVRGDFVEEEGLSKAAVMRVIQGDMAKTISERWKRVSGEETSGMAGSSPLKSG